MTDWYLARSTHHSPSPWQKRGAVGWVARPCLAPASHPSPTSCCFRFQDQPRQHNQCLEHWNSCYNAGPWPLVNEGDPKPLRDLVPLFSGTFAKKGKKEERKEETRGNRLPGPRPLSSCLCVAGGTFCQKVPLPNRNLFSQPAPAG